MSSITQAINDGADGAPSAEEEFVPQPVAPSATTFKEPITHTPGSTIPDRKVTIYVSGSVTGRDSLEKGVLNLTAADIKAAIGLGKDQYVPKLESAKITHFFNPTQQRIGLRVTNSKTGKSIVKNSAHARNPKTRQMEGFTAVLPSVMQGNLNTPLEPEGNDMDDEEQKVLERWRGLKTEDLTDGIMETRIPDANGVSQVVKYDAPLARPNGEPQPVAYMLERNKEAFPGFKGKEIKSKIHNFDGMQYYTVPPTYVHYIVGSMQDQLIDKQNGMNLQSDVQIEIHPLSPNMNERIDNSDTTPHERMVALELEFKDLDMGGSD